MRLGIALTTIGGFVLLCSIAFAILHLFAITIGGASPLEIIGYAIGLIIGIIIFGGCMGGIPLYWGIKRLKRDKAL